MTGKQTPTVFTAKRRPQQPAYVPKGSYMKDGKIAGSGSFRDDIMASLQAKVPVIMIHALNNNYYVAQITNGSYKLKRSDLVQWAAARGLTIDPKQIGIRSGRFLRMYALAGSLKMMAAPGFTALMRDTNTEVVFTEPGDEVLYVADGIQCQGMVRAEFDKDVDTVEIVNNLTKEVDVVARTAVIQLVGAQLRTPDPILVDYYETANQHNKMIEDAVRASALNDPAAADGEGEGQADPLDLLTGKVAVR